MRSLVKSDIALGKIMDWDYFRNAETGKFRLKRLPKITKPIRVADVTDISGEHEFFRGLDMPEGIKTYQELFDHAGAYEIELEDYQDAIAALPKEILGSLAGLAGNSSTLFGLLDNSRADGEDTATSVEVPPSFAEKASGAGLVNPHRLETAEAWAEYFKRFTVAELKANCKKFSLPVGGNKIQITQRLADHVLSNENDFPHPTLVHPSSQLKPALQNAVRNALAALDKKLEAYPPVFQETVWDDLRLDWDCQYWRIDRALPERVQKSLTLRDQKKAREKAEFESRRHKEGFAKKNRDNQNLREKNQKVLYWVLGFIALIIIWSIL